MNTFNSYQCGRNCKYFDLFSLIYWKTTSCFTIGNQEVSGLIKNVRDGQNITMTYTIDKDSKYVIDREGSGLGGWISDRISAKSEEITINVSSDIDGTTISRDQYIKVKEIK